MLSQQRKSCRDITFRIHNQKQQNLCRDKDYFCRDKQNMKEVNSLSQQEAKEQHKKNGNKKVFCRNNKSYGMIKFYPNREELGRDRN